LKTLSIHESEEVSTEQQSIFDSCNESEEAKNFHSYDQRNRCHNKEKPVLRTKSNPLILDHLESKHSTDASQVKVSKQISTEPNSNSSNEVNILLYY